MHKLPSLAASLVGLASGVSYAATSLTVTAVDDAEFLTTSPGVYAEQAPSASGITLRLIEGTVNGGPYFETGTRFGIVDFPLADVPDDATITDAYVTLNLNTVTGTLNPDNSVANPATIRSRIRVGDGSVGITDTFSTYAATNVLTDAPTAGPLKISLAPLLTELNLISAAGSFLTVYNAIAYGDNNLRATFDSLESPNGFPAGVAPTLTVTYTPVPEPVTLGAAAALVLTLRRRRPPTAVR